MDIIQILGKFVAIGVLVSALVSPMRGVADWDEPGWLRRYVVSAVSTVFWASLLLFSTVSGMAVIVAIVWVVFLLLGCKHPVFLNFVPFLNVLRALPHRLKADSPTFIVERVLCLRPFEDVTTEYRGRRDYKATYSTSEDGNEHVLEFRCNLAGVTDEFVEAKANAALGAMHSEMVVVDHIAPGHWLLHFYEQEPANPLDEATTISAAELADWDGKTVTYGVTEFGEPATLSYAQTSGIVVGGVPGAGKSAGATLLTLPLLKSPMASVAIFDGKGGVDWAWAASSAVLYNNDCDLDLETATDQLESLARQCVEDLKSHPWSATDPDFWHTGASAMHPFHLVVIDECQTLFDAAGRSKDDKALIERCKRAVATMVRKGRSAGWCVMLLTQKPTADSIPTNIRDNCVVRFALRVTTREASEAVLGTIPEGDPTPTEIPSTRKGGAVVQAEDGHTMMVRFAYLPVAEAKQALAPTTLDAAVAGLTD